MSQTLVGDWLFANDADRNPVVSDLIGNEHLPRCLMASPRMAGTNEGLLLENPWH